MKYPTKNDLIPVVAQKLFSFREELDGLFVAELTVGPDDDPIVKLDNLNRAVLPQTREELEDINRRVLVMKFLHWKNQELLIRDFRKCGVYGHTIQPTKDGNYLIAHWDAQTRKSAVVADSKGVVLRSLDLGIDTEGIQITEDGMIWVRYGDEGVYRDHPFSQRIIGCFDADGKHLWPPDADFRFSPWCNHMNVVSDHCVWFSNVHGAMHKVERFKIARSTPEVDDILNIFANCGERFLWAPFYSPPPFGSFDNDYLISTNVDRDDYRFHVPVDMDNKVLNRTHYATRGAKMYFISGYAVYVLDLSKMF